MTDSQADADIVGIAIDDYGPDDGRVRVIQEAITYSRRFSGSWFVVHAGESSIEPTSVSQDLLLLRSLGINVNLCWGSLLLIFGGTMLVLAWRDSKSGPPDKPGA